MIINTPTLILDAPACRSLVAAGTRRLLESEARRHGVIRLPPHLDQLLSEVEKVAMSATGRADQDIGRGGRAEITAESMMGEWQSCQEAAKRLGVTTRQIRRKAQAGELQARKTGGAWWIHLSA